jgi:diguanylate cyclase (GGDEF)-like protein/PAS domain S-box-containing protein
MRDVIGEERYRVNLPYVEAALRGEEQRFERPAHTADGTLLWHGLVQYVPDVVAGQVQGVYIIVSDISAVKAAEAEMRKNEHLLRESQAAARIGSYINTIKTGTFEATPVLDEIFGITKDYPHTNEGWVKFMHPDYMQPMTDALLDSIRNRQPFDSEYKIIRPSDGVERWMHGLGKVTYDDQGNPISLIGTVQDITERKLALEQIQSLAFFDPLTGLPNRRLLMDRLHQALAASLRHRQRGALMLIDLDNFKTLNDTHGHNQGDLLLQQVAARLKDCVRDGDSVARLGGDEFVVMLEDLSENALQAATQAAMVAEKILTRLGEGYDLGSRAHSCTSSIGIALFGDLVEAPDTLLMRSDLAMYRAKDAGRNTLCFYDPQMQVEITARVVLEEDLRAAIQQKQFSIHYQSQVNGQQQVTGVEALLRWQHPLRGLVPPVEFIPKAEKIGLILPLGLWVLESACRQLALWADRPQTAQLTMAVNVSVSQFHDSDFVDKVLATLKRTGARAELLKLELTESLLVANVDDIVLKMNVLRRAGIRFSLDDFGTGYSSLSLLKRLPLDQLKIDQSFVRNILSDPNDAAIAKMVIVLASTMGVQVIAEGVETIEQRDLLATLGCDNYQGYLFSRPLPIQEFEAQFGLT